METKMSKFCDTFFVLNGLLNGEEGVQACTCGFGHQLKDGWYFQLEGDDDGVGPFLSREETQRAGAEALDKVQRRCLTVKRGGNSAA
jgi:hypothetical protein